ncbi:MAG TPA: hypothetical protein VFS90_19200 [Pyrinomonadaceae bacterium]|nr:hypothetical protein [Pyrinomonadaceae bacterium]
MKKRLVKSGLVLICIVFVALPLFAQRGRGGGGGGGSTGCAIVETPRLSTPIVYIEPNAAVGVFDRVTNCASGKKRYTVTGSSVSSCGKETVFATGIMSFAAGESKNLSVGYPIAMDTCPGPMTVTISVYDGGTLLSSGSASLTVE